EKPKLKVEFPRPEDRPRISALVLNYRIPVQLPLAEDFKGSDREAIDKLKQAILFSFRTSGIKSGFPDVSQSTFNGPHLEIISFKSRSLKKFAIIKIGLQNRLWDIEIEASEQR